MAALDTSGYNHYTPYHHLQGPLRALRQIVEEKVSFPAGHKVLTFMQRILQHVSASTS